MNRIVSIVKDQDCGAVTSGYPPRAISLRFASHFFRRSWRGGIPVNDDLCADVLVRAGAAGDEFGGGKVAPFLTRYPFRSRLKESYQPALAKGFGPRGPLAFLFG